MCVMQTYGGKQIVMEEDEVNFIKKFEDPGLFLIGFKPMEKLKIHHHVRQSCFLYPEEGEVKGTSVGLVAVIQGWANGLTSGTTVGSRMGQRGQLMDGVFW